MLDYVIMGGGGGGVKVSTKWRNYMEMMFR